VQGEHNVDERFAELISDLTSVKDLLVGRTEAVHTYQLPSQSMAREAAVAMAEWTKDGNSGIPPGLTVPAFRAAIYDLGRASAQLQAYRQVISLALLEHAEDTIVMLSQRRLMLGLGSLRGLIERTGILADSVKRLTSRISDPEVDFADVLAAGEIIGRTLYSTRLNWKVLAEKDLREIQINELEYKKAENSSDMSAKNVLTGIDRLEKMVKGVRSTYGVLCEFLHPNVGDLISSTVEANSFFDKAGTRHIRRQLARGPAILSGQIDLANILESVSVISQDVVRIIPDLLSQLDTFANNVTRSTQKSQHRVLRNNRRIFSRNDPCPCLSGNTIGRCSPISLR